MQPEISFIDLNENQATGFVADKMSSLLNSDGRGKIGNLYQTFKDGE